MIAFRAWWRGSVGLGRLLGGCWLAGLAVTLHGAAPVAERFRGGKVDWARLNTGHPFWNRHANGDTGLLQLMRTYTSLDIAPKWNATRADSLTALCAYPFVFAADISVLPDAEARNLTEYMKRGGFLFIDCCINTSINPDPVAFYRAQLRLLTRHFPTLRVVDLPATHEVYTLYFEMKDRPPVTRRPEAWSGTSNFPLRALYVEERMVGMVSIAGLQCAWDQTLPGSGRGQEAVEAMKMAINIYVYAMTR